MIKILIVILVGLLSTALAFAEADHEAPCRADVDKLCKDVKPGEGRIAACLKEHEAQLSEGCKVKAKTKVSEARKALDTACKGDIDEFCKDIDVGGGRVAKCLKENREKVSKGCKTALNKLRRKHKHGE